MAKDKPKPDIIKQFKACQDVADKLNASSDVPSRNIYIRHGYILLC
jgi:hypothetical protein